MKTVHFRRGNMKDISGQTFRELTAVEPTDRRKGTSVVWLCRCSCGNLAEASQGDLVSGSSVSCGCVNDEHRKNLYRYSHHVDGTCIESLERCALRSDNKTGYTGVSHYDGGRYRANITFKGKRYYLGTFETLEEAVRAREHAKEDLHGEFLKEYYREKVSETMQ